MMNFFERGEEYVKNLRDALVVYRNVLPSILLPAMQSACECYLDHVILNLYQYRSRNELVDFKGVTHNLTSLYKDNLFDRRKIENTIVKKYISYDGYLAKDLSRLFLAYRNNRYIRPEYLSEPDAADMLDFFNTVLQCKKIAEEFNEYRPKIFEEIEEVKKAKADKNRKDRDER